MPKRTGSNKLKKARSGGPRRARQGAQEPSSTSPRLVSRRDPRDDETRPERRPREEDRSSSPSPAATSARPLSLMERFQALPDTTRYAVMFGVTVVVAIVLYFAFTGGSTPGSSTVLPPSSQIPVAPSGPSLLPSAMLVPATAPSGPSLMPTAAPTAPAATATLLPSEPAAGAAKDRGSPIGAPAAPPKAPIVAEPAQPKAPAAPQTPAVQPQPKAPAPAPGPGGDNPY